MELFKGGVIGFSRRNLSAIKNSLPNQEAVQLIELIPDDHGRVAVPEELSFLILSGNSCSLDQLSRHPSAMIHFSPRGEKIAGYQSVIEARTLRELRVLLQSVIQSFRLTQDYENRISELKDRSLLFDKLLDKAPEGIAITDIDGNIRALNELATVIFGYKQNEEVIGRNILEMVYAPDHLIAFQVSQEAREHGISEGKLIRYQHPDGNIIQVSLTLSSMVDANGNIFGYIGSSRHIFDWITPSDEERQRLLKLERIANTNAQELETVYQNLEIESLKRQQIEDHRDFLTKILESTTDIVSYGDENLQLRYLNKAGLDFFGFKSNDEIQGLRAHDLHPASIEHTLYKEIIPLVRENKFWIGENWLENKSGARIPVSQVITYHPGSNPNYAFATIMRDISDMKLREQEIRNSREMYQNLAEASRDMILTIDGQNRIRYINQSGLALLGVESDQVVGKSYTEIPGVPIDQNDSGFVTSILASGTPKYIEEQILLPAGRKWMGTWLVPIQEESEQITSILAICRDITHLKETEEQLSLSLARERELGELKSRFISLVSHEFRTPLATILSSVEILETYGMNWGQEKRAHHIQRIKDTVQSLDRLLDDILLIGRKESGNLSYNPEIINPIEVCTQIIQDMILTDHHRHQIRFSILGECKSAKMDPGLIRHILINLLSNAEKFSYIEGEIDVIMECLPDKLKFTISDQGIGIPPDDLDKLFDAFNRGKNAKNIPGTGLGLTIVKNAIDICHGTIEIESKQYEGTTVRFTIPLDGKVDSR